MIKVRSTLHLSVRYNGRPSRCAALLISDVTLLLSCAVNETGRRDDGNEKMTLRWNAIRGLSNLAE